VLHLRGLVDTTGTPGLNFRGVPCSAKLAWCESGGQLDSMDEVADSQQYAMMSDGEFAAPV
jgi:hypothetical protein